MERRNLVLSAEVTQLAPGWTAKVRQINHFKKKFAGKTSLHESYHAVAAILTGTEVEDASREPGPGFLGRTRLKAFNKIAFVAAHAFDCDGTGHDLAVLRYKRHNIGGLIDAAKETLRDKEDEVHAAAVTIEEEGTVSGTRLNDVINEAGRSKAEISVVGPDGEETSFLSDVKKGQDHRLKIVFGEDEIDAKNQEESDKSNNRKGKTSIRPLVSRMKQPLNLMKYRNRLLKAEAA